MGGRQRGEIPAACQAEQARHGLAGIRHYKIDVSGKGKVMSDKFQPLYFGPRIRLPKDDREVKPEHRERGSTRNFRAANFLHPDGSFQPTKDLESEEREMGQSTAERQAKLKEITEVAEKFKRGNPEAAERAEADAAAWVRDHEAAAYPFETAVSRLRAAGESLSNAIREAAAASPTDHDDFLRRAAEGKARELR